MNTQDEHYQEIVKRFSKDFLAETNGLDPLFSNIILAILSGQSPYQCLEDLLRAYKSLQKDYTELVMNVPAPKYLVCTQERYEEILKTGKL